jgi:hypothetical protein
MSFCLTFIFNYAILEKDLNKENQNELCYGDPRSTDGFVGSSGTGDQESQGKALRSGSSVNIFTHRSLHGTSCLCYSAGSVGNCIAGYCRRANFISLPGTVVCLQEKVIIRLSNKNRLEGGFC